MAGKNKPTAAIAYDFDGTLAPGNMQERVGAQDISEFSAVGSDMFSRWTRYSLGVRQSSAVCGRW